MNHPERALQLSDEWVACTDSRRLNAFHRYGTLHLVLGDRAWEIEKAHTELFSRLSAPGLEDDAPLTEAEQRLFLRQDGRFRLVDDLYFAPTPSILDDDLAILLHRRDGGRQLRIKVGAEGLSFFGQLLPALRPDVTIDMLQALVGPSSWRMVQRLVAEGALVEVPAMEAPRPTGPQVRLIAHSAVHLETPSASALVDPMLVVRSRPAFNPLPMLRRPLDAVLITHSHWDHFNLDGLLYVPRTARVVLPRHRHPDSIVNVDMAATVRQLGFTDVVELAPWEETRVGDLTLTALPYFGEGFGPECPRDWMTWHARVGDRAVLGLVDACRDDFGDMDEVVPEVLRRLGPVDALFAPCSGFTYPVTHFTRRPFQRSTARTAFTGGPADVQRWAAMCRAARVVPYALFHTGPDDVDHDAEAQAADPFRSGNIPALAEILAPLPSGPLAVLSPGEVLPWAAPLS